MRFLNNILVMQKSWVYIFRCSDGSYYTGCTSNIENRINEHNSRKFKGYTSSRLPVKLVYKEEFYNIRDAISAERRIKKWSRNKKLALIKGNFELLHELAKCKNDSSSKNNW